MIDKRTITFSAHSLDLFTCLRKYNYTSVLRRRPLTHSEPLEKGDLVHHLMERFYRGLMDGLTRPAAIENAIVSARQHCIALDIPIETCEMVISRFIQYCAMYENDGWVPIAVEEPFSKLFYEDENVRLLSEGRIDLAIRIPSMGDMVIPVDHKSESRRYEMSILSNQFFILADAFESSQVIRNGFGLQKSYGPKEWFHRQVLPYDRSTIEDWKKWTVGLVLEADAKIQAGLYPPNYSLCFRCDYKPVCSTVP